MIRKKSFDESELTTIEHLPMREMNIGNSQSVEDHNLADTAYNGASRQGDDLGRVRDTVRHPHRQAMDTAGQWFSIKYAADRGHQPVEYFRHFLHEQNIWSVPVDERGDFRNSRAIAMQEIPTDQFHDAFVGLLKSSRLERLPHF